MLVTRRDITEQFDALLSRQRTPEEIEAWATVRMRAADAGQLRFEPPGEEPRLWGAIVYLLGVGLKTDSATYLHSPDDFLRYRQEAGV